MEWRCLAHGAVPAALAGHAAVSWQCATSELGPSLPFSTAERLQETASVMLVAGVEAAQLPQTANQRMTPVRGLGTMGGAGQQQAALAAAMHCSLRLWALLVDTGEWIKPEALGMPPTARFAHAAALVGGVGVVVFGGVEPGGGVLGNEWSLLALGPQEWAWETLEARVEPPSSPPAAPYGHTLSAVVAVHPLTGIPGPALLLFGGQGMRSGKLMEAAFLAHLDVATKSLYCRRVKDSPHAPCPRSYHTASVVGDGRYVVILGGRGPSGAALDDLHIFDAQAAEWVSHGPVQGPVPPARYKHSATVVDGRFVCVLGGTSDNATMFSDMGVLDLKSMVWVHYNGFGSPEVRPGPRSRHTACVAGDTIVMFGGMAPSGWTNMLHLLSMHGDDEKQLLAKQVQDLTSETTKLKEMVESLTAQLLSHSLQPHVPERLRKYSAVKRLAKKRQRVSFSEVETLWVERAQGLDVVPAAGAAPLGLGDRVVKRTVSPLDAEEALSLEVPQAFGGEVEDGDAMTDVDASEAGQRRRLERVPEQTRVQLLRNQGIKEGDLEKEARDLDKIRHQRSESLGAILKLHAPPP